MTQVAIPKSCAAAPAAPAERKRVLGLGSSTALVVGNMIGSGIFLLPASLAAFGGISIVGWLFTAAGAMLLALLFAKLASLVPKVGGPYAYTRLGFGDFAGFWIAWGYWIAVWVGKSGLNVRPTAITAPAGSTASAESVSSSENDRCALVVTPRS